jgi:hypothetical protein
MEEQLQKKKNEKLNTLNAIKNDEYKYKEILE